MVAKYEKIFNQDWLEIHELNNAELNQSVCNNVI